jgi:hypothetical protein
MSINNPFDNNSNNSGKKKHDPALQKIWDMAVLEAQKELSSVAALLDKNIYFLGALKNDNLSGTYSTIDSNSQINVTHWQDEQGNVFVPCFSSLENMHEQVGEVHPYMSLNGREFFEMTLGEMLILDPDTKEEVALSSEQISSLLVRYS